MSRVVLKAGQALHACSGKYSLDLRDISRQAEEILLVAQGQAQRIIQEATTRGAAQQEAALIQAREIGHQKGHEEGLQQVLSAARERFAREQDSVVTALTTLTAELCAKREKLYSEACRDVIVLAIALAGRLVRGLLTDDMLATKSAEAACREALELVSAATDVELRLNPDDAAGLMRFTDEFAARTGETRHVRIVEDSSVERGGAIVQTAETTIDASVTTRLDRLAEALAADWRERSKLLSNVP